MIVKENLAIILEYTNEISIYCYYQTSKSNKKILSELIQTKMIRIDNKHLMRKNLCTIAAENGYLNILKWARKNYYPWDEKTCTNAAKNGHLNILKWCRKNKCTVSWNITTRNEAIFTDNFKILNLECNDICPPRNNNTCTEASKNGHLKILKWARNNGCSWDKNTCSEAAKNGYLKILKWARNNGCYWDKHTCNEAAKNGHLNVLKWAHNNGCS